MRLGLGLGLNFLDETFDMAFRIQRPVASRSNPANCGQQSNGIDTLQTSRLLFQAEADCANLVFCFGNFYLEPITSGHSSAGTDTITIRTSIEPVLGSSGGGTPLPLFFDGSRTATILPTGALVESDPIGISVAEGDKFWIRTAVSGAALSKWYFTHRGLAANNEGMIVGSDFVDSGTIDPADVFCYGPMLIRGEMSGARNMVAIGDSIMLGKFDDPFPDAICGPVLRAVNATFPAITTAMDAERAADFKTLQRRLARGQFLRGCTHAVVNYGINDLATGRDLVNMQADLQSIWNFLSQQYGLKVWQTTIMPYTDSNGTTLPADQTILLSNARETDRIAFNTLLRTALPSPLIGFLDWAAWAESSLNSGKWRADSMTSDGLHPNGTGNASLASTIDIRRFN